MRRVAVVGLGIVSSIGKNASEVRNSLREGVSGIVASPRYAELGLRSHVEGSLKIDLEEAIDRKTRRFMGDASCYAYLAMKEAIRDAGLDDSDIKDDRTGLIVGSGGPSTKAIVTAADVTREKAPKKVGPTQVPKAMSSGCSAVLSTDSAIRSARHVRPRHIALAMPPNSSSMASKTSSSLAAAKN